MDPETRAEFEAAQKQGGIAGLVSGAAGGASAPSTSNKDNNNNKSEGAELAQQMNPANFDLAGWMAGQQTKLSGGAGNSGEVVVEEKKGKSSGSEIKGSGGARRRG